MRKREYPLSLVALSLLIVGFVTDLAQAQTPAARQDVPIALIGGTVHPVSGPSIANATLLFKNGKITALGQDLRLPEGTLKIDITGKHVYPGMIAANTVLGLVEINAVRSTVDHTEVGQLTPEVRAEVAVNPDSRLLPVARSNGVLLALTIPSGGLVAGRSAVIQLDGWTFEDLTLRSSIGLHINWPVMSTGRRRYGASVVPKKSKAERKKELLAKIKRIKDLFADARAYRLAMLAELNGSRQYHPRDLRLQAMLPVIEKRMPVFVHANRNLEIRAALDWAKQEDIKMVLVGGYDAADFAAELRREGVAVIIAGTHRLPTRRHEAFDAPFTLPKRLEAAGVSYCIATGGGGFNAAHERNLPYNAATAAAHGLSKEAALKSVTLYPAQILGVADRVGSIELGKDATIFVTDGDPLEIRTKIEQVFIQGRRVDLDDRHKQLYRRYTEKYRQLGTSLRKVSAPKVPLPKGKSAGGK